MITRTLVFVTALALGGPAWAIASPSAVVSGLLVGEGDVRVLEDHWEIDCSTLADDDRCLALVTTRTTGAGVIEIYAPDGVVATLDGAALELPHDPDRAQVTLADGEHTLTLQRQLVLNGSHRTEWTMPACEIRHLVMHSGAPETTRGLIVSLARVADRAPGYTFELAVKGDGVHGVVPTQFDADPLWQTEGDVHRLRVQPTDDRFDSLRSVVFEDPGELLHHGGLMLGIGGQLNHGGSFRMRLEYEVALDEWILPGLAIDADTERGFVLVPRVELASPMILVIPSFSVGLGLPIRMRPDPDVGVRFIVGGQFGPIGLAATFDLYPLSDGLLFEPVVVFRLSL